jgi:hypothetical protein
MATKQTTKRTKIEDVFAPRDIVENTKARRAWLAAKQAEIQADGTREANIVGVGTYQHLSVYALAQVEVRAQVFCPVVRAAIEARKPLIAASYRQFAVRMFDAVIEEFGPAVKGVYNSRSSAAQMWRGFVSQIVKSTYDTAIGRVVRYELDEAKLDQWSHAQADAIATAWTAKIETKIGGVENARIETAAVDLISFTIRGTLNGHDITLHQEPVLKASSKGTLFYQFPARIYVDGKFVPEAQFDAAVSAEAR